MPHQPHPPAPAARSARPRRLARVAAVSALALGVAGIAILVRSNQTTPRDPIARPPRGEAVPLDPIDRASALSGIPADAVRRLLTMSPLPAPPPDPSNAVADDPAAAHLGRFLFFDERLSGGPRDGLTASPGVSCAHCHQPQRAFADGLAIAQGLGPGRRHTPSILNTAHNRWFNWDGRRDSHWAQAIEAIERPNEMGSNRLAIARLVHHESDLARAYARVFGPPPALSPEAPPNARPAHDDDPADAEHPDVLAWAGVPEPDRRAANTIIANIAKAIAAYQRTLVSAEAPFDRFVAGLRAADADAIASFNERQRRGAALFAGPANCWQCHHGPNLTDSEFHNILTPLPAGPGAIPRDPGRFAAIPVLRADPFNAQGDHADRPLPDTLRRLDYLDTNPAQWGAFKTPSLRSVARTPPYFHNGHTPDLASVLRHYNTFDRASRAGHGHRDPLLQPLNLSDDDLAALEAFLHTLTDPGPDPGLLRPPDSPVPGDAPPGR